MYVYIYITKYIYLNISIFIYIHTVVPISIYIRKTELTEYCKFCFFAANGKWKFVFLGQEMINGHSLLKDLRKHMSPISCVQALKISTKVH
jgi:hypothetical protein